MIILFSTCVTLWFLLFSPGTFTWESNIGKSLTRYTVQYMGMFSYMEKYPGTLQHWFFALNRYASSPMEIMASADDGDTGTQQYEVCVQYAGIFGLILTRTAIKKLP